MVYEIPAEWLPVRCETNRPSGPIGRMNNPVYFSNTECLIIPHTNREYVIVCIKGYTVVKHELLTFTVSYLAHGLQSTKAREYP